MIDSGENLILKNDATEFEKVGQLNTGTWTSVVINKFLTLPFTNERNVRKEKRTERPVEGCFLTSRIDMDLSERTRIGSFCFKERG